MITDYLGKRLIEGKLQFGWQSVLISHCIVKFSTLLSVMLFRNYSKLSNYVHTTV